MKNYFLFTLLLVGTIACDEQKTPDSPEKNVPTIEEQETQNVNGPIAPFPTIPENLPNKPVYERMKRDFEIPSAKQVGIPGYPKSYAISGQSKMDLKTEILLPTIILVTSDQIGTVIDYYKKVLKGWNFDQTQTIFWQGEDEYFPNEERNHIESVFIKKSSQPLATVLFPEAKTEIIITYNPDN